MKRIIGKKYKAIDNSYSINLTEPLYKLTSNCTVVNRTMVAGTYNTPIISCTILTQPFMAKVGGKEKKKMPCILVTIDETGDTEMVLFFERGVVDKYIDEDFIVEPEIEEF